MMRDGNTPVARGTGGWQSQLQGPRSESVRSVRSSILSIEASRLIGHNAMRGMSVSKARSLVVPKRVLDRINRKEIRHKGELVAIEPESGAYFIGRTMIEAFRKARAACPGKEFVFKRIGYRWTIRQAGGLNKALG